MLIEFAPFLSALLLWAAFPPLGFGFLAFVAPAPFLAALRRVPTRRGAALLGLSFGLAFFAMLLWWVKFTAYLAVIALVVGLAGFTTLYAVGMWHVRRWPFGPWWMVAVGGWALMEFARGSVPFGGFPWGLLGYPAGEYSVLREATAYIGTTGWSVAAAGVAAGVALLGAERARPVRWLVIPTLAVVMLVVLGAALGSEQTGPVLRAAVVQGNSPCPPGERCPGESLTIYESHLELTRTIEAGTVDLVVWPESSAGSSVEPVSHPERGAEIAAEAERLGAYILVGATRSLGPTEFTNLNVLFSPAGDVVGEYVKRHPVPFGEYVPLRSVFDFIPQLEQVPKDLVRGEGPVVFDLGDGRLGSVISFEGAFPQWVRSEVRSGAQLMVVATNTSSYGESEASDQFIGMTRMRAAEMGVGVIHAAITGRSAFIGADGSVGERTGLYEPAVLAGSVAFRSSEPTLYTRLGDWVQYLAVMAMLATVAVSTRGFRPPAPAGRNVFARLAQRRS